jgi:CBS-domain-containing membrane protein
LFVALLFLDIVKESAIITAIGASSFMVFAMPHRYSAKDRRILGGYLVGLVVGFLFYSISEISQHNVFLSYQYIIIFSAAASVGLSIFFMVLFNIEHAPACGVALGLVINEWTYQTIIFILGAILWFILIRRIFTKWFIDLT